MLSHARVEFEALGVNTRFVRGLYLPEIPTNTHSYRISRTVPVYFLGTAGLRDFQKDNEAKFKVLMSTIKKVVGKARFKPGDCKAITGEEEAAYGWIAANYTLGAFSGHGARAHTVGYVELGGASAQVAFLPHRNELPPDQLHDGDVTRVRIGSQVFDLFLKSYSLGANKAWKKYEDLMIKRALERLHLPAGAGDIAGGPNPEANPHQHDVRLSLVLSFRIQLTAAKGLIVEDPGSPYGRSWSSDSGPKDKKWTMKGGSLGSANSRTFHNDVKAILDELLSTDQRVTEDARLINAIRKRPFVGGANFWWTTRTVFGLGYDGKPKKDFFSFGDFMKEVEVNRKLTWDLMKRRRSTVNEKFLGKCLFSAEWLQQLLVDVFGVNLDPPTDCYVCGRADANHDAPTPPRQEDQLSFRPYNGPGGAGLTWTLGRAVLLATGDPAPEVRLGKLVILQNQTKALVQELLAQADEAYEQSRDAALFLESFTKWNDDQGHTRPRVWPAAFEKSRDEYREKADALKEKAEGYQASIDVTNEEEIFSAIVEKQRSLGGELDEYQQNEW